MRRGIWERLFSRLTNERGQINFGGLLTSLGGNLLSTLLPTQQRATQPNLLGGLLTPQNVLGAGLIGTGLAQRDLPGYATEATSYLRNRLSPTGIGDQFTSNLNALQAPFRPLLDRSYNELLDNIQQRYIAGQGSGRPLPSSLSTAMGGPEILALRNAATRDIIPAEQNFLGGLALNSLGLGQNAAQLLLDAGLKQSNPLGNILANLGLGLLGGQSSQLGGLFPTGTGAGTGTGQPGTTPAGTGSTGLGNLLGTGGGNPYQIGQLSAADILKQMQAGTLSTSEGLSLLGRTSLLPGIGDAAASAFLGNAIGSQFPNQQFAGTALGGLGGAATGAAIGSIIPGLGTAVGAIIGGLFGGGGGLFGAHNEAVAQKAYNLSQDLDSQKDQVLEIGNIGQQFLQQFGIDPSSFVAQAQQLAATSSSPADEQGMLATLLGQTLRSSLSDAVFAQVAPQLRIAFIDYMTRSTYTAPNSRFAGGPALNLIGAIPSEYQGSWAQLAGLKHGGYLPQGGLAIVGEEGTPELLLAGPGTTVVPLMPN